MANKVTGLFEIDPFKGDSEESLRVRYCDICSEPPYLTPIQDWRVMYYDPGEDLSICELCVENYLSEKP